MARTRPLPRKLSARSEGKTDSSLLFSIQHCSLTLRLRGIHYFHGCTYIYMCVCVWRIEWIFNEREHLTEIFRDFARKFSRGWKFAWPSLLLIDRDEFSILPYFWMEIEDNPFLVCTAKHVFIIEVQLVKNWRETVAGRQMTMFRRF